MIVDNFLISIKIISKKKHKCWRKRRKKQNKKNRTHKHTHIKFGEGFFGFCFVWNGEKNVQEKKEQEKNKHREFSIIANFHNSILDALR